MRYNPPKATPFNVGKPMQGSIEAIDPYSSPIPGQSLTERGGKHSFEKPAQFSDPDEATMFVINRIEDNEQAKEVHLSQLASGIPIEYIVNTISHLGFQEGLWNPDVAELIKPSLAMYFILIGMEANVPLVLFNPQHDNTGQMQEEDIARNMSKLNPDAYTTIQQTAQEQEQQSMEPEGFLAGMPEGDMVEEPMVENIPEEGLI